MATGMTVYGSVPNAIELIDSMGLAIAKSKLLGCENPDQGRVLAMACIAKGLDPLSIAQRYDIICGKLAMKSDAMLAEFRARGGRHKIVHRKPDMAAIKLSIDGETETFQLSWEEAQHEDFAKGKDGKVKANYATPRKRMQMLWARVVSDAVRAMCPEVNTGIYTPEENDDLQDEPSGVVSPMDEAVPVASLSANAPQDEVEDAEFTVNEDKATGQQIARLSELFTALDVNPAQQLGAIKKRGASDMGNLSAEGASDLISALEAKQSAQVESVVGRSQVDPVAMLVPSNGPCAEAQIAKIKSLIKQIAQSDGGADIAAKVKTKLEKHGLAKIADLSRPEADSFISALSHKNLDLFFNASLRGAAKNE